MRILFAALALCGLLYVDAYLIPEKRSLVRVDDLLAEGRDRQGNPSAYTLVAGGRRYYLHREVFVRLTVGSELVVHTSALTGSLQGLALREEDDTIWEAGFLRARMGRFLVPATILACVVLLAFWKTVDQVQGHAGLSFALVAASLLLWYVHLDLRWLDWP